MSACPQPPPPPCKPIPYSKIIYDEAPDPDDEDCNIPDELVPKNS
jgi:hypothetical protein